MCNILFIVFDILELKITHENSDQQSESKRLKVYNLLSYYFWTLPR